jgi:hypothetical protein
MVLCPHCWGTTVGAKELAKAKNELGALRKAYAAKKAANKALRGRSRGMAGNELATIGKAGRALRDKVEEVDREAAENKTLLKMAAAAIHG